MCLIVMHFNFLETEAYTEAELTSAWISREVESRSKGDVAERYFRIVTAIVDESKKLQNYEENKQVVVQAARAQLHRYCIAQCEGLQTQE